MLQRILRISQMVLETQFTGIGEYYQLNKKILLAIL